MATHRRFIFGLAGTSLGNGLLAVSFLLDGGVAGLGATVALLGAIVAMAGTATLAYIAHDDHRAFSFEGSTAARQAPTLVLVGGVVSLLAGTVNLALLVLG